MHLGARVSFMKNDNLKRGGDYSIAQLGDPVVLTLSVGFVVLFVAFSLFDLEGVASLVSTSFAWTAKVFGTYFQMLLLATFFIAALRKGLDFLLNEDKSQPPKLIYQDADLCVVDAQKKTILGHASLAVELGYAKCRARVQAPAQTTTIENLQNESISG